MPQRYDAAGAPHVDLRQMRRETAGFARILTDLSDAEILEQPHRKQIVAEAGLQARVFALQAKECRDTLSEDEASFVADTSYTATLPIPALRHLFSHSALHLNVELRDLEDAHWPSLLQIPDMRTQFLRAASAALLRCAQNQDDILIAKTAFLSK